MCFTTLCVLFGTGDDRSPEATGRVIACVDLEAVGVIPPPQTLPNVMEGKTFAFCKLLNVPQLVQKELRIEPGPRREKYRPPQRDSGNGGLSEQPSSDAERQTAPSISQLLQLGPDRLYFIRKLDFSASKLVPYFREISHFSPLASYEMRRPSLRMTIVPSMSVRTVRAPARVSAASTSALG